MRHLAQLQHRTPIAISRCLEAGLAAMAFLTACEPPPKPGNILVVEPGDIETKGDGSLFRVDPKSGARTLLSDFGNPAQGTEGVNPFGIAVEASAHGLVIDPDAGTESKGALFRVDPKSGTRTVLSDFGNTEQGTVGAGPLGVAVEASGHSLVTDPNAGTDSNGALFRVDTRSGARILLSDFGDPAKGTPLGTAAGVAVEPSGHILVIGSGTGTDPRAVLFRVDPKSGVRRPLSDFGDPTQGPPGQDPFAVAVEPSGLIFVMDANAGTDAKGALFRVDAKNGARALLSDFGNPEQGPQGVVRDIPLPFIGVAVQPAGDILVTTLGTGTDAKGTLFRVEPMSGKRTILSDFGNSTQGPLGENPVGVAVTPER